MERIDYGEPREGQPFHVSFEERAADAKELRELEKEYKRVRVTDETTERTGQTGIAQLIEDGYPKLYDVTFSDGVTLRFWEIELTEVLSWEVTTIRQIAL